MSSRPSLGHNATWTVVGNIVFAACQLGMLTALAKLGSAAEVGRFSVALAVATPVVSLCMMQLRNLQATDTSDRTPFGDYFGLRLLGMAAALLLIGAIAVAGYDGATAWAIVTVGAAKVVEAVSDVAFGLLQRHERMRRIAISQIAKGVLSIAAIAAGTYLTGSVVVAGLAMTAAGVLTLVLIDLPAIAALRGGVSQLAPNLKHRQLVPLATLAFPLGLAFAMLTLVNAIPRLVLERHGGLADVGVFAPMMTLVLPGTMFVSAIGQAMSPRLATAYQRRDRGESARLFGGLLAIALVVGCGGLLVVVVAGRWVLGLLYSAHIAAGAVHLPLVMLAGACSCVSAVFGCGAVASGRLRAQPFATAASLVFTLVMASLLIPHYGIAGAAITALVSAASMAIGLGIVMWLPEDR